MKLKAAVLTIIVAAISAGCSVTIKPLPDEDDSYYVKEVYTYEEIGKYAATAEVCYRYLQIPKNRDTVEKIKEKVRDKSFDSADLHYFESGFKVVMDRFKGVDILTGNSRQQCKRYGKNIDAIAKQLNL